MSDAFWEKVIKLSPAECWEWSGYTIKAATSRLPYGVYRYQGKQQRSHRLAYKFTKGEIPHGMLVCHSCDNPSCCNPDHLWLGTYTDNNRDRESKNRGVRISGKRIGGDFPKGSRHPNAKLTESDILLIRKDKMQRDEIAKKFGIKPSTVKSIQLGRIWKHV